MPYQTLRLRVSSLDGEVSWQGIDMYQSECLPCLQEVRFSLTEELHKTVLHKLLCHKVFTEFPFGSMGALLEKIIHVWCGGLEG